MANSVDPDQTAPEGAVWTGSALFAYAILSDVKVYEILRCLQYPQRYRKHFFSTIFLISPQKHILFYLTVMLLMNTHNICFCGEIWVRKILCEYPLVSQAVIISGEVKMITCLQSLT